LVDRMIALPGQLFYTTQIPVCLWFLTKNKKGSLGEGSSSSLTTNDGMQQELHPSQRLRDRRGETLFIDARKIGTMISRTQKELDTDDIAAIAKTYHDWRTLGEGSSSSLDSPNAEQELGSPSGYADIPGYCKSATLEDMRKHDYVLTPGRYVGAAPIEDDGIPFETKMKEFSDTLYGQMRESTKLDAVIRENLEGLGYGE